MQVKKSGEALRVDRRERRREAILEGAVAMFAERGYSGTDTQVLADRLGVGKGTLYRYFPTKHELFLAAVDGVMRRLHEEVSEVVAGVADPVERVAGGVRATLEFFAEHPEFAELLIQERAQFKDRKRPTYFEHQDVNIRPWRELFRSLTAEGRVRGVPAERITDVLCNLMYGVLFTNYFTGQRKPPEEQTEDILDVVFFGILSRAERRRRGVDD
jgi:AcrR family transcriptional regulator